MYIICSRVTTGDLNINQHRALNDRSLPADDGQKKSLLIIENMAALTLQSYIWTNHRISGTMSFAQFGPKWRFLAIGPCTTFADFQTRHISTNLLTQCQMWWWTADGLCVLQPPETGHLSLVDLAVNSPLYHIWGSNIRSVWASLTAAWLKTGLKTAQYPNAPEQSRKDKLKIKYQGL